MGRELADDDAFVELIVVAVEAVLLPVDDAFVV